jgi:hypothetical protein
VDPGPGKDKGGSGLLKTALILALPAGAYYAYENSKSQSKSDATDATEQQKAILPASLGSLVQSGREAVSGIASKLPVPSQIADLVGAGKSSSSSKAPAAAPEDRLHSQKQADAEAGFTILPPEAAAAAADSAAADAFAAAAAAGHAAQDSLSAAADEFPGVSSSSRDGAAEKGEPFSDMLCLPATCCMANALLGRCMLTVVLAALCCAKQVGLH